MRLAAAIFALIHACAALPAAEPADWPHWRGPQRNGHSPDPSGWTGEKWPLVEKWSKQIGRGSSSPLVAGGKVYVLGWGQNQDHVHCLDAATGEMAWRASFDAPQFGRVATGDQGLYDGPSSTPELDPATGLVFTLGCDGDLRALDTRERGKERWHLNLYATYDPPQRPQATARRGTRRDYGYTTAPLVHKDWLLVEVGDDDGNVMAFDKLTGRRVWASQNRDPAGHTGGLAPLTVEGVPCLAVLTMRNLVVMRLDAGQEGKTVGEFPFVTDFANSIASPAVQGSSILITSRYNHEEMIRVDAQLSGLREVWRQKHASGVCSPVIRNGKIYWVTSRLMCLDFETGKLVWEGGRFGDAGSCIATSDGRLIAWGGRGVLALADSAERSPAAYRELVRRDNLAQDDVWPHVAFAGGSLFLRDRAGNLTCFRVAGESRRSP